ncbi:lipocalin-like domain-containing protein, partial [Streptomyces lavendulae]|uniref:lipocalin-like domain-containing protein n=1 Tax=Streptomyces lavendulae TaxID=1914 RepID=UPI0036E87782
MTQLLDSVSSGTAEVPPHLRGLGTEGDPDRPDDTAGCEWWYVNAHLQSDDGRDFSVFASFFRVAAESVEGLVERSHFLCAGWIDPSSGRYVQLAQVDGVHQRRVRDLLRYDRVYDPRIRASLARMLDAPEPPSPDLPLTGEVTVTPEPLCLRYGSSAVFRREARGGYRLTLLHPETGDLMDLSFRPDRPAAWQGESGEVADLAEGERGMRCYSVTRMDVTGEVVLDGARHSITRGTAWYDHEWGLDVPRIADGFPAEEPAWDWCALHLGNGWDLSVSEWYRVRAKDGVRIDAGRSSLVVAPLGGAAALDDWGLVPVEAGTSLRAGNRYTVEWRRTVP